MKAWKKWTLALLILAAGGLAAVILATPGEPRHGGRLLSEWMADLNDRDAARRQAAQQALQAIGPAAVPWLTGTVARRDAALLKVYRRTSGWLPARAQQRLHDFLKPHSAVIDSQQAALGLKALGPAAAAAVPVLIAALTDPSPLVCQAAAAALGDIGGPAVPALRARLGQADGLEFPYVTHALGKAGPAAAAALPELAAFLGSSNTYQRDTAMMAIIGIGAGATNALLAQLDSTNTLARTWSARTIGELGLAARAVWPQLLAHTNETHPAARSALIAALVRIMTPEEQLSPVLAAQLNSTNRAIAFYAMQNLGTSPRGVRRHREEIARQLSAPEEHIRLAASNALARFPPRP